MNPAPYRDTVSQSGNAKNNEPEGEPLNNTITTAMAREITGDHWVRRPEAARYMGISPQTLANNKASGPRYAKVFGSVLYRLEDLKAFMAQRVVPTR